MYLTYFKYFRTGFASYLGIFATFGTEFNTHARAGIYYKEEHQQDWCDVNGFRDHPQRLERGMMSHVLVRDLSFEAHQLMDENLRPGNPGRDWKTLADKMGYPYQKILYFESLTHHGPVFHLIKDYEDRGKTVSELLSLLEEMERRDLIEDLQIHIKEAEGKRKQTKEKQCGAVSEDPQAGVPATLCEDYDVYIIYASPDKPFADELLTKLEEKPYSFRVCIDYRDFLPGSRCGKLETSTEVIEKGCKVLLIMSENFNRCESADFEAKIALKISPAARQKVLIPIKYKPCTIPSWLKHICYIDYTTEEARSYFWKKLLSSLGYKKL